MRRAQIRRAKIIAAGVLAAALTALPAYAATLKVKVDSLNPGGTIPNKYAFCAPAATGHTTGGQNINPSISWSKGPKGTHSYAVILFDTDSPAEHREMMNKEGVTMTADVKRHNFYHWVLVDIPANVTSIKQAADSNARVLHGKPATSNVGVKGLNDYTKVTASNDA
ncbi:MAG: YbhB/YbcL family Raf kinase inhibitor-like protein, partial [Xanthobacteraceae bacterium]